MQVRVAVDTVSSDCDSPERAQGKLKGGKEIPFVSAEELQDFAKKQRSILLLIVEVTATGFTCLRRDD